MLETSRQHYDDPEIYQLLNIHGSRIATPKRHSSLEACNGVSSDMFLDQQGFSGLIRIGL